MSPRSPGTKSWLVRWTLRATELAPALHGLNNYLQNLKSAPPEIQALVCHEPEKETFRFGNGATKASLERWRLPTMIGSTLVLFWTSVVPVSSLGLLLGRDFMDAIGAVRRRRRSSSSEY